MSSGCPKCGSMDVSYQVFQENQGGKTVTRTKSKYKEKRHGCLWWVFIGCWWWIIEIFLWIFLFLPRVLIHISRKRDYNVQTTSISKTKNRITYRHIGQCNSCGYHWKA